LEQVLARLTRLERENRYWKALGIVAVGILGLILLLGASKHKETVPVADELRARQFVLVGERGNVLGRLGALPHGSMGFALYDAGTRTRALLAVDADGASSLSLVGRHGKGSLLLKAENDGAAGIRLFDQQWKTRVSLGIWPDGSPFLQLADRDGKNRAILGYSELVVNATGELIERPESSLILLNGNRTVIWRAP
jgi:hypothetical protein